MHGSSVAYGVLVNVERCTQENEIHEINFGEATYLKMSQHLSSDRT